MQATASAPTGTDSKAIEPRGTLAQGYVPKYLLWAANDQQAADLLMQMFNRRKDSPARYAIWKGYWALKCKFDGYVESLRDRGGLLFLGQASAIEAAQRVVDGQSA
ncbi:MAG: hypothetical protein WBC18_14675 [Ottowia sp.]|uniref:hypothetical protein n=1 Tax=Ottowia sp. TaxID=1898956 RepID=UPI003C768321